MSKTPWTMYVWPGLPQLWYRGSWLGLVVALIATVILDIILVATFGWSELFAPGVRNALWAALGLVWLGSITFLAGPRHSRPDAPAGASNDSFCEALDYYLQGNWFQAEHVLSLRLRQDAHDLDARLMLATLLRHTGRLDEAETQLDLIQRCDGAWKWVLEITRERQMLAEAKNRRDSETLGTITVEPAGPPAPTVQAA